MNINNFINSITIDMYPLINLHEKLTKSELKAIKALSK